MQALKEVHDELLMAPAQASFEFTRDELMQLLMQEFGNGWNQCSDSFKLDVRIVPDGEHGMQNFLTLAMGWDGGDDATRDR